MEDLLQQIENLEKLLISIKATIKEKDIKGYQEELEKAIWSAHNQLANELKKIVLNE